MHTLLQWHDEFDVIAALPDALAVKEDIRILQPDVILMDIDMPGCSGVEAVKLLRSVYETLPVIMFTVFDDDENIFNAICAGANGYLLKKNIEQLPAAITDVLDGGAPMTGNVAKRVLTFVPKSRPEKNADLDNLSRREIEILEYIVKGYSYKMIAGELVISVETVRSHIKKIYKKLQVNSATEAVYKFRRGN